MRNKSYPQNSGSSRNNNNNRDSDNKTMISPIPVTEKSKLENPKCNFSLYSPRMVSWGKSKGELKADENAAEKLETKAKELFANIDPLLKKKKTLLDNYLVSEKNKGVKVFSYTATTDSPFISGLGSGHPTETGMILDRNIGVPYIPASSIKGVMRIAYALNISNGRSNVPSSELDQLFGTEDDKAEKKYRGQLIFLDAYPEENVKIDLDIMNPHYGEYYLGKNKHPVETENPVPIKFMTLSKGVKFTFRCLYKPLSDTRQLENIDSIIESMFKTAFETIGFGSKTAIGYGHFREDT